jgi:transcriptional adapter 2-alpha
MPQADEELLLLEAVEMYGLGNWAAVAEHVGTQGEPECRAHYYAVYIDVPSFPEPQPLPSMRDVNRAQARARAPTHCRHFPM